MLTGLCFVALVITGVTSTQEHVVKSCNIDFTTHGMPICMQVCQEWCWATVIGEFKEYYQKRDTNDSPVCRQRECKVVGVTIGKDCCKSLDPSQPGKECGGGTAPGTCGGPASYKTMLSQLKTEVPSQKWVQINGAPTEAHL